MNELDRRIAIEVMGEPEPGPPEWTALDGYPYVGLATPSENWELIRYGDVEPIWEPRPFSSDIDQALRAVDKVRGPENLGLTYLPDGTWKAGGLSVLHTVQGETLPEAICNLLLALKEKA